MNLTLYRFTSDRDSSCGVLYVDGIFECFTLEDEYRVAKVKGMTRIKAGKYTIKYLTRLTPLTEQYRRKYPWFDWHMELQDVENFNLVYIHIGNWHTNTDACILVGQTCDPYGTPDNIGRSTQAFKKLYLKMKPALLAGQEVTIEIIDCDRGKTC